MNDGGVFSLSVNRDNLRSIPSDLWVQIEMDGSGQLPLQHITSTFFARRAAEANSLVGTLAFNNIEVCPQGTFLLSNGSTWVCTMPTSTTIQDSSVTSVKIVDNAITTVKIVDGAVTPAKLSGPGCNSGQILKYDGSSWVCSTEADPKIGTLTSSKWCITDGTSIQCTQDAPASGDPSYESSASSPNDAVYVDNGGKVGIGTTTPTVMLEVNRNNSNILHW